MVAKTEALAKHVFGAAVVLSVAGLAVPRAAHALVINTDLSAIPAVYQNDGGKLSATGGAGFTDVTQTFYANIAAASSYLQSAIQIPDWTTTISFQLASLPDAVADAAFDKVDANGRPITSTIRFSTVTADFVDPKLDNSQFDLANTDASLGGGSVNVSRFGNAVAGGPADGRYDVLTTVLHEEEHSLGYLSDLDRYNNVVPTTGPNAGQLVIPASLTGLPSDFTLPMIVAGNNTGHIDGKASNGLFNNNVVADPGFSPGQRALLTGSEIYGLCVIEGCTADQVNPNPILTLGDLTPPTVPMPEPGSLALLVSGIAGLAAACRRQTVPTGRA